MNDVVAVDKRQTLAVRTATLVAIRDMETLALLAALHAHHEHQPDTQRRVFGSKTVPPPPRPETGGIDLLCISLYSSTEETLSSLSQNCPNVSIFTHHQLLSQTRTMSLRARCTG